MKNILAIVVGTFGLLAFSLSQAAGTIGFMQGNIWYSPDPFFSGQTVRLYSGVFNGSPNDIIGVVEFFVDGALVGTTDFTAAGGGRLREVWTDWKSTGGNHEVTARIVRTFISRAGKPNEPITVASATSGMSARFVDADTDGDGIGNLQDPRDDRQKPAEAPKISSSQSANGSSETAKPLMETATVAAASVVETIDEAADKLREPLLVKKSVLEKEIEAIKKQENTYAQTGVGEQINVAAGDGTVTPSRPTGTPTDTIKRIGRQLYLLAVIAALFIIDHKIILYILLAFIVYKFIRWLIRRFLARRDS